MTDEAMSPLRRRMIEDMMIRKLAPKTQRDYVQRVKHFAAFLGRSPDTASFEDVRPISFTWRQVARAFRPSTQMVTALRFFFKVTLDRPETTRHVVFVYEPHKLPRVLSSEEVLRLLEAAPGPKHKAALSVAYGAGLRAMGGRRAGGRIISRKPSCLIS